VQLGRNRQLVLVRDQARRDGAVRHLRKRFQLRDQGPGLAHPLHANTELALALRPVTFVEESRVVVVLAAETAPPLRSSSLPLRCVPHVRRFRVAELGQPIVAIDLRPELDAQRDSSGRTY
jgi:hypothetical protein